MHFPLLQGRNYLLMNVILIMGQIVEALSTRYLGPDYSQVHHITHPLICIMLVGGRQETYCD
jgi:hypothetical protein